MDNIGDTILADRLYAAMLASAIGDAMGAPVEGWSYQKIEATYGVLDRMLPYDFPPDYHNHFHTAAGSVTDDTRLRHLIAKAIINCNGLLRRGDVAQEIVRSYHKAETELECGFLEEYTLGALYGGEKLIWGGQMTNGFLMANAPLGLICPCDPEKAFALSYEVDFISDGYARYAAAMGAAAVSAALRPQASPESVVEDMLEASRTHRVEGPLTRKWQWYDQVFSLNERLVNTAVDIALKYRDIFAVREIMYGELYVSDLGSEAAQTLAVALGMFVAAQGDLRQTIIGCVNYGRDNDSYASLAGAIAGAACGSGEIPDVWRDTVIAANPELDFKVIAMGIARIALKLYKKQHNVTIEVMQLLS